MRPSRDEILMDVARSYARRSTCDRNRVGAVISLDGRVIVPGYNGAPAGMEHCNHKCACMTYNTPIPEHGEFPLHTEECPLRPCTRAVHAEANAIAYAARHGLRTDGTTVHTTLSPCVDCARLIINAGIIRVVYHDAYRDPAGVKLLREVGLAVVKYGP